MNCYEDIAQNCMFSKLRQVSRYVTNIYAKEMTAVGLTPVQSSMMTAIKLLENANINALSEALNMDRTTINRNLKPLIREEFVFISEGEDKREKSVSLTKKGKVIYAEAYIKWQKAQSELENKIGKQNWNKLNIIFDDIIKKIE